MVFLYGKIEKESFDMVFEEKYLEIKDVIAPELAVLETSLRALFQDGSPLSKKLLEFVCAPSKRIRPTLAFLYFKAQNGQITENQQKIMLAVELIHSATLIHDDVIDKSETRRGKKAIRVEFDENLAVVAGDFLLSIALEKIIETGSMKVLEIFTRAIKNTCQGEISQYFAKFSVPSLEQYIEKSKNKTAALFQVGIEAGLVLEPESRSELIQDSLAFAENFGIAFQIRDDLINFIKSDGLKPDLNDFTSGIYTAPVIFARQGASGVGESLSVEKIKSSGAIEKSQNLMDNYFTQATSALNRVESSEYKRAILDLIELLETSI